MKIYIVHTDALDGKKPFHKLTDEEIEKMWEEDDTYISKYESLNDLAHDWNGEDIFYPNMSYMRVIND